MSHSRRRQAMVVLSTLEQWSSFKQLLQETHTQTSYRTLGSNQICSLTVDAHSVSLCYADLKADLTEDDISQAIHCCFKSCAEGICMFLLLIKGGHYTNKERRMVEILKAYFGEEALRYLVVLSLDGGKVADTLEDTLLELISICDGRYCQITSSAPRNNLCSLLALADHMLTENGMTGYTEAMLTAAKKRGTEDSSMKMLRQKVQEAEEKEEAFRLLVKQQDERRAKEMQELREKHAEERKREAAERNQHETKRESLVEAVTSHRAALQLLMSAATDDEDTKRTSIILLGVSGSGKSSALDLILERAGNQYSVNGLINEPPRPTLSCERKEVSAAGRQLVLVDTPELWDEDGVENLEVVKDCLALSLPGPHIYLVVLQVGRFTQGECEMLGHLQKIFGRDFAEHAVVLFVHFDGPQHRPMRIDDYVTRGHASLQGLIQKCGSRYYELNVAKSQNALSYPQVKDLLSGISKLVASYGGSPHSVRRFTVQELQARKAVMEERQEGALEDNYLLSDSE